MEDPHRRFRAPTRPASFGAPLLGDYPPRIMCCLIAALLVALAFVHAPPLGAIAPVGWGADPAQDLIEKADLHRAGALLTASAAPAAAFEAPGERAAGDGDALGDARDRGDAPGDAPKEAQPETAPQQAAILNPSDLPRLRGGLGRFYMSIVYPEEARRAGIQGELVLDFVVEPDGRVADVTLHKSLHPLCDSSAISSLQATRFAPAQQNGAAVRTRARLPVRFQLLPPPTASAKQDTALAARQ